MKEFARLENGQLVDLVVAMEDDAECPKGLKELVRDEILPPDEEIIFVETKTKIQQTYKK